MMNSKMILAIFLQALICSSVTVCLIVYETLIDQKLKIKNFITQASPVTRIIDGTIAHQYQFPWHVSLHITKINSTHPRYCGGSLISKDFILTAASCLVAAESVRVDMGSILFLEPQISQVSTQFVSHNQFNPVFNTNNIGIIRLSAPVVEFTNRLRPILFPGVRHANELYVGQPAFMSGFGVFEIGKLLRFSFAVK